MLVTFEVQTTTFWITTMTLKLLAVLSLLVLATADGSQYNNAVSDHFQKDEAVLSKLENLQSSIPIDEISQGNFRLKRTANSIGYGSERPSQTACRIYREAAPTNLKFPRIDGVPVPPGEFPYMGALMYPKIGDDDFDTLCGCFLISERYVLTTAHCVKDLANPPTFVRFGVVLWNSTDKVMPPIDVKIENILLHPEYVSGMIYNDIALIRLRKDVEFNYLVRPGCLYSDTKDIDPETRLVAIGWGANYNAPHSDRFRNEALQMANVSTVLLQACNETYKDLGFQKSYRNGLYKGHYCTTGAGIGNGSCLTGHAGSPVQFMQNQEWTIVGIVSFGVLSCSYKGPPDVNTRVAHYLDWIESIVWKWNFRLKRTDNSIGYRSERPSQTACRIYREAAPSNLKFPRIDGVPVPPGEYPYMGALMYPKVGGDDFVNQCGCSLVSERYVLTTAHCITGGRNQPTFVRFGVVLWNSTDKVMPPIDVEIESISLHPEYVSGMTYHNIALIRLRKDVEFNSLVRPGCLYSDTKDIDPEIRLVVIGWGANFDGPIRLKNEALQMANVSTVPLQVCNETFKVLGFDRSYRNGLNKGQYCTTGAVIGNGTCLMENGGSPVQFMQNEEWIIVGMVSFGILSCIHEAPPDVSTRVAHYLDWIESIVWKCPSCLEHTKRPSQGSINKNTNRPSQEACRRFTEAAPFNLKFPKMDGIKVSPGEYPHIGAVMRPKIDDGALEFRCSSALISERYALTNAQCVVNRSGLGVPTIVRFGVVVWNSMEKNLPPYDVEIENIIRHPKYKSSSRYHDIALIRLRKDVAVNLFVRPACLYSDTKDVDPKTRLVSISWGWNVTSDDETGINEALQMVNVSTVPLQDCNATLMELGPNRSYRNGLNQGHYCTSNSILENKQCLISNAGSPVELVENQKSTIVGLASFGLTTCTSVPDVNTRVAHYLDWIEDIVWPCTSYQKKFVETMKTRPDSERPSQIACKKYRDFKPTDVTHRIVGDSLPVRPGEFPHMGAMLYPQGGGGDYDNRCGSSLISERYVLTAAHCVNDQLALPSTIRFGVVVWNSVNDDIVPVDVEIEEVILHPCYKSHLRYHDVALIRLVKEVEFSFFVRPACLYSNTEDVDPDTRLAVIGWGVTNIQSRKRSGILLKTNVTTFPLQDCNATHINWGTSRSYRPGLNEGHYCASDPGLKNDACQSDSGGPMQLVENKESTIVGIVSFGNSCGSSVPSVYARVAHYLDWIESIVWPSAAAS